MRFVIFNLALLALLICAGLLGLLSPFLLLGLKEWLMLGALGLYGALGAYFLALRHNIPAASHVHHSIPILALVFTGLGLLLAGSSFTSLDPGALAIIFKEMVSAISPNVLGVFLMVWLRETAFYLYGKEL